jgi:hypothetical protein
MAVSHCNVPVNLSAPERESGPFEKVRNLEIKHNIPLIPLFPIQRGIYRMT